MTNNEATVAVPVSLIEALIDKAQEGHKHELSEVVDVLIGQEVQKWHSPGDQYLAKELIGLIRTAIEEATR